MKKKNIVLRICCALLFLALSGIIMLSIYTLSSEDGLDSGVRSENVTEALKQEVRDRLENTPEGVTLSERVKALVIHAKTLFSTHYHELTSLEQDFPSIHNVHVDVKENKKQIEFRYRIVDGKADKSYGIHVARLAGIPSLVISRASTLLDQFETSNPNQNFQSSLFVMDPADLQRMQLIEKIQELDVDSLSARDALSILYDLKSAAEKIEQ